MLDLDLEARGLASREEDATAARHLHWFLWLARFSWVFVLCAFALEYYYADKIGRVRIVTAFHQLGIPILCDLWGITGAEEREREIGRGHGDAHK